MRSLLRSHDLIRYLFSGCLVLLPLMLAAQKADTFKLMQHPSSYRAYFDSLNFGSDAPTPQAPPTMEINLLVHNVVVKEVSSSPLVFTGKSASNEITLTFTLFDTTQHQIRYDHDKPIDGKKMYGHDGIYPGLFAQWNNSPWKGFRYQYLSAIEIRQKGKTFRDSPAMRAFYFNCPSSRVDVRIYEVQNKNLLIIAISGGDGAGSYQSLLLYENGRYVTDYEWEYGYDWYSPVFGKDYFKCADKKGCLYEVR